MVLVLCLFLVGACCYAIGVAGTEREGDGIPIEIIVESAHQGEEKGNAIVASINGHALSVVFTENFGQVFIEVTDTNGGPVDMNDMYTPNGYNAYIHYAGSYIITFTFADGDVYYGEFDVVE